MFNTGPQESLVTCEDTARLTKGARLGGNACLPLLWPLLGVISRWMTSFYPESRSRAPGVKYEGPALARHARVAARPAAPARRRAGSSPAPGRRLLTPGADRRTRPGPDPQSPGRPGGTGQPPPKGADPRPARAAPVPSRDELSDVPNATRTTQGLGRLLPATRPGTPGSPKPLRPPRATPGPSQPTKADQGPATLRLLLPRPAPLNGSGPAPHPSLRGFQRPRAPRCRRYTDLALLLPPPPPRPLSAGSLLAGNGCWRLHLPRRPTRNASLLALTAPRDPDALRARGKLLLPLSRCVTSGPNTLEGGAEVRRSGSDSTVAASSGALSGAGAVARTA